MKLENGTLYFNFAHVHESVVQFIGETRFGYYLPEAKLDLSGPLPAVVEKRVRTVSRSFCAGVHDGESELIRALPKDHDGEVNDNGRTIVYRYMGKRGTGKPNRTNPPEPKQPEPPKTEPIKANPPKPEPINPPKPINGKKTVADLVKMLALSKTSTMLYGPSGTGKTYMAIEVCKSLGLDPYVIPITSETKLYSLIGYMAPSRDGQNVYMTTPFRKAIDEGRPVIVDEADSNAELLLYFNSASNGFLVFPDKSVQISGWLCLTANTNGTGASAGYIRQALDMATKKRVATVYVGYNKDVEKSILPDHAEKLWKIRENIENHGIENVLCTTRDFVNTKKMLESGFSLAECIDVLIVQGMDADVKAKMLNGVSV